VNSGWASAICGDAYDRCVLAELSVSDLGVIDGVTLLLDPGMTALTGETGAGKTMLVGAIGLLIGERADASIVRPGADEATVQGRFIVDGDEVVLTRVVPRTGRSRAYRDGRLITAGELSELASGLVDLHAQHAHVGLLTTASQRRALDRFAAVDLRDLDAARTAVRSAEQTLEGLGGDGAARERERDFLAFQLDEIDSVGLTDEGEDDRLLSEESILADADAHRAAAGAADAALSTERGARDHLAIALAELGDRVPFAAVAERLRAVEADLADAAGELRGVAERIDGDPERLAAVQERRARLADVRRRYVGDGRSSLADLFVVRRELSERLAELESHAERAAAAEAARERAVAALAIAASAVGQQRRDHAPRLAEAVRERLTELALPKAEVQLEVGHEDPGDEVAFLLALNPGLPAAPLAKAASGGELARTMLALRLIVGARVPTLVFDEVDAGVGGAAARAVGRALAALAEDKQVLVVTHLPQVAAFADAQVALSKQDDGATTVMRAEVLAAEPRVRELARMLSGLADSDTGQDHAEELLATAAAERGR
jgi:DNA repair protein RecN (Recombination protein N)